MAAWRRADDAPIEESDSEGANIAALKVGGGVLGWQIKGGWSVADVQKFWQSKGAWSAINSDAGDVAQLSVLRPDGNYDVVPPRQNSSEMRLTFGPDFAGAPVGGSLMYCFITESPGELKRRSG